MSRDWSQIGSAEAFDILCENRTFSITEDDDIFFTAALFLGDVGEIMATNILHNPKVENISEEKFIWARTQAVAEGLTFTPRDVGPTLILQDGRRFEIYLEQAIVVLWYYSDWFWELTKINKSGGEVVVREIREYAEMAMSIAEILESKL